MDWLAIEISMLKTLLSGVCLLACSVNLTPVLAQLALPDLTIDGNRLGRSVIFEILGLPMARYHKCNPRRLLAACDDQSRSNSDRVGLHQQLRDRTSHHPQDPIVTK